MSWLDEIGTTHPPGFWDLPEDKWTRIGMDLDTAKPTKDARGWSIIKMVVDWGHGPIDSVLEFWSHNDLRQYLYDQGTVSGKILLEVMRHKVAASSEGLSGRPPLNKVKFRPPSDANPDPQMVKTSWL